MHELNKRSTNQKKTRVGRGGKRGKTSGRGHKGQKARAGRKIRPAIRDFIKKLPKNRGHNFNPIKAKPEVINLSDLEKHFKEGEVVSPGSLLKKDLVRRQSGSSPSVKILGSGEIKTKLSVEGCQLSESARKAIEKAGGSIK